MLQQEKLSKMIDCPKLQGGQVLFFQPLTNMGYITPPSVSAFTLVFVCNSGRPAKRLLARFMHASVMGRLTPTERLGDLGEPLSLTPCRPGGFQRVMSEQQQEGLAAAKRLILGSLGLPLRTARGRSTQRPGRPETGHKS